MKKSYNGNLKPFVTVLARPADREKLRPILEAVSAKKEICYGKAAFSRDTLKRSTAVIAFFTAGCEEDLSLQNAVLAARSAGVTVIPVPEDEKTRLPETLQPFFGANNALYMSHYTPEDLATRLLEADALKGNTVTKPQKKRFKTTVALLIAAALLLLAVSAALLFDLPGRILDILRPEETGATQESAPAEQPATYMGFTLDQLQKIQTLYLVGGHRLTGSDTPESKVAWLEEEEQEPRYVWMDDSYGSAGSAVALAEEVDLSFLPLMSNLRTLILIEENITALPDLSGLTKLTNVQISFCPLQSAACFEGCASLKHVTLEYTDLTDLSPLNSCPSLTEVSYRDKGENGILTDLGAFAPASLRHIYLYGCDNLGDVSSLSACDGLTVVYIDTEQFPELSFLSGKHDLSSLTLFLRGAHSVADLSVLDTVSLTDVSVEADSITGTDFLSRQSVLHRLCMYANGDSGTLTLPSLSNLPSLEEVDLRAAYFPDLSFLAGLSCHKLTRLYIGTGSVEDWEALSQMGIAKVDTLQIDIWGGNFDYGAAAPYITDLSVNTLQLSHCRNIDFTRMPQANRLVLHNARDLTDLEGIASLTRLTVLELINCTALRSLAGLEESPMLNEITLNNAPRLTDVEGLYGLNRVTALHWVNMPELLPDFTKLSYGNYLILEINAVPLVESLDFLNAIPDTVHVGELVLNRLDYVTDAAPLTGLKGYSLTYPAQLEDQIAQAQALGLLAFTDISRGEPCGTYETVSITVDSLEELASLSPLKRSLIKELRVTGGTVLKQDEWSTSNWQGNKPIPYVASNVNEPYPAGQGTVTDLSVLEGMTGLETLELSFQPLISIDGIQNLENLREVSFEGCDKLTDISPLFALNGIENLNVSRTGVTSLEGIQNLHRLHTLTVSDTAVTDLSPLRYIDYTDALAGEGFMLDMANLDGVTDYSFLTAIPAFSRLCVAFESASRSLSSRWTEYVADADIRELEARNLSFTDDESLRNFVAAHPSLTYVCLSWNSKLTDLTPLTELPYLERVKISKDMNRAAASLNEKDYSFELEIEG